MQRAIWIVTFLIIAAGAYYWFWIHEEDKVALQKIADRNELQSDSINVVTELERRLELKYIGHGKHLQTIQDEYRTHYQNYQTKMDSINTVFDQITFNINEMDERLQKRIDELRTDLRELTDQYDSFKRTTNRENRNLGERLDAVQEDIQGIQDDLVTIKQKVKIED